MNHSLACLSLVLLAAPLTWGQPTDPAALPNPDPQAPRPAPAARNAAPRVPDGVKALRNQVYAKVGDRELRLDLYLPKEAQAAPADTKPNVGADAAASKPARVPLVIWIHGGGWRGGSKNVCASLPLTERGFAAASIEYRFVQDDVFPAQIHDCKAAIRWLRAKADEFNLDPSRFGVWGASAGGHLAALLGTSCGVPELEGDIGDFDDRSSCVQAVCDWFGPTDLVAILGPGAATADPEAGDRMPPAGQLVHDLFAAWPKRKPDLYRLANPITFASKDDAPFLIMHGDQDPLVPLSQSEMLDKALAAAGAESKLHIVKGGKHAGFKGEDLKMVAEFFEARLKPATRTGEKKGG